MGLFSKKDKGPGASSTPVTGSPGTRRSTDGSRRSGEFLSGIRKSKKSMKAVWNGAVLAQSSEAQIYDGTFYFPGDSLNMQYFRTSEMIDQHPKLGRRFFYTLEVNGMTHSHAAFYYPSPTPRDAQRIANWVAFWKGVPVTPLNEADVESSSSESE